MKERYSLLEKAWLKKEGFIADIASKLLPNQNLSDVHSFYNIKYAKTSKLNTLDVHTPASDELHPCVIYVHGGAWISADKHAYNRFCKNLAKEGFTVVNINYRLVPKVTIDDCLTDIITAINFVLKNSDVFKINTDYLFTCGDSAGCHLTGWFLKKLFLKEIKLNHATTFLGAGMYYGVYDFTGFKDSPMKILQFFYNHYKRCYSKNFLQKLEEISVKDLPSNFPPIFTTAGKIDKFFRETERFLLNLKQNGNIVQSLIFDKEEKEAKHAFLNFVNKKCSKVAFREFVAFLNYYVLQQFSKLREKQKK